MATARTSTSPGFEGTLTLEIAQLNGIRFVPTDKIRYHSAIVRSAP